MSLLRTKRGFRCDNCFVRFKVALEHPTLGVVCPLCHGQMTPRKRKTSGGFREAIAIRDGWICQICGLPVDPKMTGPTRPSIDHIVAVSEGGSNKASNLRLAHQSCNAARHDQPRAKNRVSVGERIGA